MSENKSSYQSIGERIKLQREVAGLSQEQVADQLHVTRQAVSNWERGKTNPDLLTMEKLCSVLNVDIGTLAGIDFNTQSNLEIGTGQHDEVHRKYGHGLYYVAVVAFILNCFLGNYFPSIVFILIGSLIHFMFNSAAKHDDFSMLAGYDPKVRYNRSVLKELVLTMEKHITLGTGSFLIVTALMSRTEVPSVIGGLLVLAYAFNMIATILYLNYKYASRLFEDQMDFAIAKASSRITTVFIAQLFIGILLFITLMEIGGIANNTPEAGRLVMFLLPYLGLIMGGFFYESVQVPKSIRAGGSHKVGKGHVGTMISSIVVLGMMIMYFIRLVR